MIKGFWGHPGNYAYAIGGGVSGRGVTQWIDTQETGVQILDGTKKIR